MTEKLIVPRRRVRKDWYEGLDPNHTDRTHNDVHDDSLNILPSNVTHSDVHADAGRGGPTNSPGLSSLPSLLKILGSLVLPKVEV